jgi:hypothetical protein
VNSKPFASFMLVYAATRHDDLHNPAAREDARLPAEDLDFLKELESQDTRIHKKGSRIYCDEAPV